MPREGFSDLQSDFLWSCLVFGDLWKVSLCGFIGSSDAISTGDSLSGGTLE